jgi:hypothetical protein
MQELKKEIENILETELKGFYYDVEIDNSYGLPIRKYMYFVNVKIAYQPNEKYDHLVKFSLREDLYLFINNGGNIWHLEDTTKNRKYEGQSHQKIPFRTPKKEKKAVLKAIKNICQKYKSILKDIASRGLLLSEDLPKTIELINSHQKTP